MAEYKIKDFEAKVAKLHAESMADPRRKDPSVVYAMARLAHIARLLWSGDRETGVRQLAQILEFKMAVEAVDMTGEGASSAELLLACRIVATQEMIQRVEEKCYGRGAQELPVLEFLDRRIGRLNRQLQQAIMTLARVRRLRTAPVPILNVAQNQQVVIARERDGRRRNCLALGAESAPQRVPGLLEMEHEPAV